MDITFEDFDYDENKVMYNSQAAAPAVMTDTDAKVILAMAKCKEGKLEAGITGKFGGSNDTEF